MGGKSIIDSVASVGDKIGSQSQDTDFIAKDEKYYAFLSNFNDLGKGNYEVVFEVAPKKWVDENVLETKKISLGYLKSPASTLVVPKISENDLKKKLGIDPTKDLKNEWYEIELVQKLIDLKDVPVIQYPTRTKGGSKKPAERKIKLRSSVISKKSNKMKKKYRIEKTDRKIKGLVKGIKKKIGRVQPNAVAVLDVGQGNFNIIYDNNNHPMVYFDVGCGCHQHTQTAPPNVNKQIPAPDVIILSHWDEDHWEIADTQNNNHLKNVDWVVPEQTVGPVTHNFYQDIQPYPRVIRYNHSLTRDEITFELIKCTGTNMNNSGVALVTSYPGSADDYVLLPGDAQFRYFTSIHWESFLFINAPHHGSNAHLAQNDIPFPRRIWRQDPNDPFTFNIIQQQGKMAFSYGMWHDVWGNHYAYNHPSPIAITRYNNRYWTIRRGTQENVPRNGTIARANIMLGNAPPGFNGIYYTANIRNI
ncbi:hypothetical protein ACFLYT_01680 [Nanoarchaeota archaeon]